MTTLRMLGLMGLISCTVVTAAWVGGLPFKAKKTTQDAPNVGLQDVLQRGLEALQQFWEVFGPGGKLHPQQFLENKGHLAVEGVLGVVLLGLLCARTVAPGRRKQMQELTETEIAELCEEWQPEPLFQTADIDDANDVEPPIISGPVGAHVMTGGKKVLNMVSLNFLGIAGDKQIMEVCRKTIHKYGVGSCGPRGFYGTVDVHLELEERLAKFMGTQESIIYSYDLATIPSIIPAFANAKDLLVLDEACNFAIQNGASLSRAQLRYFKHNDMADLERVLQEQVKRDRNSRKPLNRRFVVVEGIYQNLGDVAPLADIYRLKQEFKYRLMVDETVSLGVLGTSGRGAAEHHGLKPEDVEISTSSLGNTLASVGGFCAGSREIVDHQRLSGLGYCFSASLPPYLAVAAQGALEHVQQHPELLDAVRGNARKLRALLKELSDLVVVGSEHDTVSPLVHLRLAAQPSSFAAAEALLQQLVQHCLSKEGVLLCTNRQSPLDKAQQPPSIRLAVTAAHSEKDLAKTAAALRAACKAVLSKLPGQKSVQSHSIHMDDQHGQEAAS